MSRKIVVKDDLSPEDEAMVQALYSRSDASVTEHLEKLAKTGSGKFMEKFFVGYGHKSIGDCGTTTIFIENVSMLAVKAIQDSPLYRGQETSSRYCDFTKRPLVDPIGSETSARVLATWMRFYTKAQEPVAEHVRSLHPRKDDEDEATYERAVKARVFDILRGFLPVAVTTQFSWHTDLRQAGDKLPALLYHPLDEVRALGGHLASTLGSHYEHSFDFKVRPEHQAWQEMLSEETYYDPVNFPAAGDVDYVHVADNLKQLNQRTRSLLDGRPLRGELPHWMNQYGSVTASFLLDFGSWRDLQRHRSGVRRVPLLSRKWGFHPWYIARLPPTLQRAASDLIKHQYGDVTSLGCTPEVEQYYLPFGALVPCEETWGLPALCYITDLRTTKFVHPTLRRVVQRIAKWVTSMLEIPLHANFDPDDWDVRRGSQTIVEKP